MRISDVTNRFIQLHERSGCYMKSRYSYETKTMTLSYTYGSNAPIAEIYDYKDSKNYRLRLHPHKSRYGRTAHNNRLYAVLYGIQTADKTEEDKWAMRRYSSYIQYRLKVIDTKTGSRYELHEHPLEFDFINGKLVLDYKVLESYAYPNAPAPVAELDSNTNLQTLDSKLTAILQGV